MAEQTKPVPVQFECVIALRAAYAAAVATIAAVERAKVLFDRCQWAPGSAPFPLLGALPLTGEAAREWVKSAAGVGMVTPREQREVCGD